MVCQWSVTLVGWIQALMVSPVLSVAADLSTVMDAGRGLVLVLRGSWNK